MPHWRQRKPKRIISDSTAYRLVFCTIGEFPQPTVERKARQLAFLTKAGITGPDLLAAVDVLTSFKTGYANLTASYNQTVVEAVAASSEPDVAGFVAERETLVQTTRNLLAARLSPKGLATFNSFVQREKAGMRASKEEVQ